METPPHILHRHGFRPIVDRSANSIELDDHPDPGTPSDRIRSVKIELLLGSRGHPSDPPIGFGLLLRLGRSTGCFPVRRHFLHRVLFAFLGLPELLWVLLLLVRILLAPVLLVLVAALLVDDTNRRTR
jgi:hypothetical protein